jgi:DNA-binding CsgD family transcriptional regulator
MEPLTAREMEVLRLIVQGGSARKIAGILGISVKTVMTHRANIMAKLGVHNSATLVIRAYQLGLVDVTGEH